MKKEANIQSKIDTYISRLPVKSNQALASIRKKIRKAVPDAEETFSYGVPTFKRGKLMIHYAAFKSHVGLYPGPSVIEKFKKELNGLKLSKGTIQFPLNTKLPIGLIVRISAYALRSKKNSFTTIE